MYWSQYRRTFIPVQILIAAACLFFVFAGGAEPAELVKPVILLEAAAVFGARMAARFKASVDRAEHPLPNRAITK